MKQMIFVACLLVSLVESVPERIWHPDKRVYILPEPVTLSTTTEEVGSAVPDDVCEPSPDCTCSLAGTAGSLGERYARVLDMKRDMAVLELSLASAKYKIIDKQVVNITARLETLARSYGDLPIEKTALEIARLRVDLMEVSEKLIQLEEEGVGQTEVDSLKEDMNILDLSLEESWKTNLYKQNHDLKGQVTGLEAQVSDCRDYSSGFIGDTTDISSVDTDWCDSHEVQGFQDELTHRWISSTTLGTWFKDSFPPSNENKTHIFTRVYTGSRVYFTQYDSYDDFITDHNKKNVHLAYMTGLGVVAYNGSLYYPHGNNLYKYDFKENSVMQKPFSVTAGVSNVNYHGGVAMYVDLKADEKGLWAIYASKDNNDKLVISKLNPKSLDIEGTWKTNQHKVSVCATFMICGRLFTLDDCTKRRPVSTHHMQYIYDTKTNTDDFMNYHLTSKFGKIVQLTYNSREKVVFGWDQGHLVTYGIDWSKI